MGGPMSVYEADRLPHLRQEMRLIEWALSNGRPVLGVCLGSQLLAEVLGGKVRAGARKELGWHNVRLTEAGQRDPLWAGAPTEFPAFHWHGDVFDAPPGCESLASSEMTDCQAFRSGDSAYGLLFHLEVTGPLINGLLDTFADELRQSGGDPESVRRDTHAHLPQLAFLRARVFEHWASLCSR
jgi:GMP synthase (glutamine-hydrolysing)